MTVNLLPDSLRKDYEIHEWNHACAILKNDFQPEWNDVIDVLENFRLHRGDVVAPGGGKSPIAQKLDAEFEKKGWQEKAFDTQVVIDKKARENPTHKIDCYKNRVALEIEWNNKDPFYDRDLNNFRILFDLRAISVGVIVTRCDDLQDIFDSLGKGTSYGNSTTHMSKLLKRVNGGGGGGCPILVFGISKKLYSDK
ncbi:MAG: BglII/BstYI family type II restriction endonuclease [Elusimicrobiota bacterium]